MSCLTDNTLSEFWYELLNVFYIISDLIDYPYIACLLWRGTFAGQCAAKTFNSFHSWRENHK